jgi:hypothetical protein
LYIIRVKMKLVVLVIRGFAYLCKLNCDWSHWFSRHICLLAAAALALTLSGCSDHSDGQRLLNSKSKILEVATFSSYEACVSVAKSARAEIPNIKLVAENHKEDKEVGVYAAIIKITDGRELVQLCTKAKGTSTTRYSLLQKGDGAAVGQQLPGGFTVDRERTTASMKECLSAAESDLDRRKDIAKVTEDVKAGYAVKLAALKDGHTILYTCVEIDPKHASYVISVK